MATPTYTAIASITLGSSASSVEFSSIPQDYRDLVLVVNGSLTPANSYLELYINNDTTTTNYSHVYAQGNGSSSASGSANDNDGPFLDTSQSTAILQFMDYSATDKHKTVLMRFSGISLVGMVAFRHANTSAITTFYLEDAQGDDFAAGTTLALYGIAS